jgi:hypothetical protein
MSEEKTISQEQINDLNELKQFVMNNGGMAFTILKGLPSPWTPFGLKFEAHSEYYKRSAAIRKKYGQQEKKEEE